MGYRNLDDILHSAEAEVARATTGRLSSRDPGEQSIPHPRWQDQEPEDRRVAEELFQLRAAEQAETERRAREYRVGIEIAAFEEWLIGYLDADGIVLYWEKTYDREGDSGKTYRTVAVYSDGLWWSSGKSTAGRTTAKLISFWIGQGLTKDDITAANMGQLLKDKK